MKIYGQNIVDILRRLPWQYQIVVAAGSFFLLFVAIEVPYRMISMKMKPAEAGVAPLQISGAAGQAGILDPSVAYDPLNKEKQIWLAYAAEEKTGAAKEALDVILASSTAGESCKNWHQQSVVSFQGKNDRLLAPDGQTVLRTGAWRVETPALVYDPDDHGREWKLYAYKYFWDDNLKDVMEVSRHYGVIVYKYASDPAQSWSTEQWLFAPTHNYPPPPYDQMILLQLNRLDPSLQNVVTYARPSVVYKSGTLVMTLSAFSDEKSLTPDRIVMIASADHGNSWRYVGTVLQQSDLAGLNPPDSKSPYTQLAGASLIEQNGQVYLAAVLGTAQQRGVGTFIFGFDDFSKGLLQHDPQTGAPVILHRITLPQPVTGSAGGGAAAYTDACNAGLMITEQKSGTTHFDIYQTKEKPINPQPGEK